MSMLKSVPGTYDLLPDRAAAWDRLRDTVARLMAEYAYGRIETPHFEFAELFARGVGEQTDIVEKEMYTFEDRGGRLLALRPEGTAGTVRAYLEARLDKQRPYSKLWYWGPMFRAERPQKGRFRQFWQFGVETIGVESADIDAEQMALAMRIAQELQLDGLTLFVNSIGDATCRPAYRARLIEFLETRAAKLCRKCRKRLHENPMRVLDCKEAGCREATSEAPLIVDALCPACRQHFAEVRSALDRMGVEYTLNGRIVRGLDYYQRTAFELESRRLGAQSSLLGGGRYDGLVRQLGGPDLPGVGWAAGIERFLLAQEQESPPPAIDLFIAGFPETRAEVGPLAERLRRAGLSVEIDYLGRSLKAQLKEAARLGARHAVVLGPDEWSRGRLTLRNLTLGSQETLTVEDAVAALEPS